nr:CotS family spore coat protein [uncultured Sellimonas sp.]
MDDYDLEVLEQYPIEVDNVRKVRGAILCETDRGLMLLKQAALSKPRIFVMNEIHKAMKSQEHLKCDELIPNKDGEFVTVSEDGCSYYLKAWYPGRECDVRKHSEILEAAKLLAKIHRLMEFPDCCEGFREPDLEDEYRRHNRELKKVWNFVRKKTVKGEFESRFLECFEETYHVAVQVERRLEESDYRKLMERSRRQGKFVHGEYNYHNILITQDGMTVVNFEHAGRDIQPADLYYFLRKIMEKHQWNAKLGAEILRAYGAVNPLTEEEKEYLALRLSYPEKFWKCANTYYNSNKAWISSKSVEKLRISIEQNEEKKAFLEQIFSFHLDKSGV